MGGNLKKLYSIRDQLESLVSYGLARTGDIEHVDILIQNEIILTKFNAKYQKRLEFLAARNFKSPRTIESILAKRRKILSQELPKNVSGKPNETPPIT